MQVDLNLMERLALFRIFDKIRHNWSLSKEEQDLVDRLESELKRSKE